MHLDDTTLDGKARVETFEAPAITFDMMVDTFDLDRYLPPVAEATEGEAAPAAEDAPAGQADEPLPLEALRSLDLSGSLKVASLKAFNLKTSDVVVQVRARDGVVRVNPLGAKLYSGTYQGDVTLDARKDTPRISLNEKLSGVQAGPLMKDLTGEDTVLGTANVTAKLTAAGATADDVTRTLNGNTSFSFTDGAIKGVNIAEVIRKAQAKLKGQPVPEDNLPNQTDFASMSGTTSMTNGLVRNNDFSLLSPLLRLSGKGEVSLPQESIDYTLTTKIVGSLEGQGGKSLDELKGVAIPVHVGGTFSKPTYKPDLGAALSEAAKAKVEEKVEEQKQKLEEKLGDQLQDKLKGLFR
jgi:AsmA protein